MIKTDLIERLKMHGADTLTTEELLSVIAPGKSEEKIKSIHRNLLASGYECYCKEMSKDADKGEAALICAFELFKRFPSNIMWRQPIQYARDVLPYVEHYRYAEQEHLLEITLSSSHKLINIHVVCVGILDNCPAHPREVFKNAIKDNAAAIILVHNHPSGNLTPSRQDVRMSKEMADCGELIGITLLDHLVIGPSMSGEKVYSSVDWSDA